MKVRGLFLPVMAVLLILPLRSTVAESRVIFDILVTFDYPGATLTYAYGINDRSQVAGYFFDPSGLHGYVRLGNHFRGPINDPNDRHNSG